MKIASAGITGLKVITPDIFKDDRGFFMETYHQNKYREIGKAVTFVQDNQSGSQKNVIRGLHFQRKFHQGKLIMTLQGEIYDVAVDIRPNSSTFKQWYGINLSAENRYQLYIPPGFAHGFCVLSDFARILYKCTNIYYPEFDCGLNWRDPDINILWPVADPVLSPKDQSLPFISEINLEEFNV